MSRVYTKFHRHIKTLGGIIRAFENPYNITQNATSFNTRSNFHMHLVIDLDVDIKNSNLELDELSDNLQDKYISILQKELARLTQERSIKSYSYKDAVFNTHLKKNKALYIRLIDNPKALKDYFFKEIKQDLYKRRKTKSLNLIELLYHYKITLIKDSYL